MKNVLTFFAYSMSVVLLATLHIGLLYVLPYPLVKINILFVSLIIFLLITERGVVVWLAFFLHFFVELYATTPFGIVLFSGTISTLFAYWVYESVITNRSWYAAMMLSGVAVFGYRLLYLLLFSMTQIVNGASRIEFFPLLITVGWELLWTTLAVGGGFFLISFRLKKFDTKVIYS